MNESSLLNECSDPTQSVTIELPCALIERIQKLADEKRASLSGIVIEALDTFLRDWK